MPRRGARSLLGKVPSSFTETTPAFTTQKEETFSRHVSLVHISEQKLASHHADDVPHRPLLTMKNKGVFHSIQSTKMARRVCQTVLKESDAALPRLASRLDLPTLLRAN
jgi:hypothetical protein